MCNLYHRRRVASRPYIISVESIGEVEGWIHIIIVIYSIHV